VRAFDHRPIGLLNRAGFEQPAEQRQRLAMASEHQAAGGVAIEPVRERRRSRQPEAQRVEMILKALATLGAAMDREAGRLVDHQHEPVAVEQPRHHLFGGHVAYFTETAITGASTRPGKVAPGFPIRTCANNGLRRQRHRYE
jgi:hypothetical protein